LPNIIDLIPKLLASHWLWKTCCRSVWFFWNFGFRYESTAGAIGCM